MPAQALASFALLGILGIGWEIENPFGFDDNDLPLDDFCQVGGSPAKMMEYDKNRLVVNQMNK